MFRIFLSSLLAATASGAGPLYEISGRVTPAEQASVTLYGVASPFTATTLSGEDGRFSLKKLDAGAYTIAVFVPGRGEMRQTVEIGPGTADARGIVRLTLTRKASDFDAYDALQRRHSVSAGELAIPEKALHEFEDAQKDLARRNVDAAVKRLEHAVEIAPQFSNAWNNLGTIAYQTRQFPRAAECFRKALEANPAAYEPLVNLGGVLINLGKLGEALDYNQLAVLVRPTDALANAQLGQTYFGVGNFDLALKYLDRAREIDPAHFSYPQLFMAEVHLRRGDEHAAADDLEDFLKHHPDYPQAEKMRENIAKWRMGDTMPK